MRTNSNFTLLEVMDKMVLAAPKGSNGDKPFMFKLNSTAAFLWKNIQGKDFERQDLARLLMNEYGISESIATPDANEILGKWIFEGIVIDNFEEKQ